MRGDGLQILANEHKRCAHHIDSDINKWIILRIDSVNIKISSKWLWNVLWIDSILLVIKNSYRAINRACSVFSLPYNFQSSKICVWSQRICL